MSASLLSLTQGVFMLVSLLAGSLLLAGAVILRARLGTPSSLWLLLATGAMLAWSLVVGVVTLVAGLLAGVVGSLPVQLIVRGGVPTLLSLGVALSFFAAMRDLSRVLRAAQPASGRTL